MRSCSWTLLTLRRVERQLGGFILTACFMILTILLVVAAAKSASARWQVVTAATAATTGD
ncbi:MAG: hypothetical protein M3Y57_22830 [Acidobacteriota bacterium]|nr:hypothetical protein [Acidobacteriota bacterium]